MPQPAAKQGDHVVAKDYHLIKPFPPPAPPVSVLHLFDGVISSNCATDVLIEGKPAAVVGSVAINTPAHLPIGGNFVIPPHNRGTISQGSSTVIIGGRPAARANDPALTCNDPVDAPAGLVVATSNVLIGG
jgi:uncharacterized Zn-binding protein involved in type VI secretion